MYKQDLVLNNLQGFTCCKTQPTNLIITLSKQLKLQTSILNIYDLQLYSMKYSYLIQIILNRSIQPIDGTLTGTTTPDQSRSANNGNHQVFHILHSSRIEASLPDAISFYTQDTFFFSGKGSFSGYSQCILSPAELVLCILCIYHILCINEYAYKMHVS